MDPSARYRRVLFSLPRKVQGTDSVLLSLEIVVDEVIHSVQANSAIAQQYHVEGPQPFNKGSGADLSRRKWWRSADCRPPTADLVCNPWCGPYKVERDESGYGRMIRPGRLILSRFEVMVGGGINDRSNVKTPLGLFGFGDQSTRGTRQDGSKQTQPGMPQAGPPCDETQVWC